MANSSRPPREQFWLVDDSFRAHLNPCEIFWRDVQPFLASKGYALRPRYHPDWVPRWRLDGGAHFTHGWPCFYEDGIATRTLGRVMDALRLSDWKRVALKRVKKTPRGREEIAIMKYFSEEQRQADPRNHCVPLLDVLDPGDTFEHMLIVIPLLQRIDKPDFQNVDEALEFCHQALEGLTFMHEHNTEHRDCCRGNIMMHGEPLYPNGRHPVDYNSLPDYRGVANHLRRSDIPIRYHFIDFGLSARFDSYESRRPLIAPRGQDKTAPEMQDGKATDGFMLDVYCVGNMFREELLWRFPQLAPILSDLVDAMTLTAPHERPTAAKASDWIDKIRRGLSQTQLSARLRHADESLPCRLIADSIYQAGNIKRLIVRNQAEQSANYQKYAHIPYRIPNSGLVDCSDGPQAVDFCGQTEILKSPSEIAIGRGGIRSL